MEIEEGIRAIKLFLYLLIGAGAIITVGSVIVFCYYGYWRSLDGWNFLKKKRGKDKKLSGEILDYINGRWYK